MYNSYTGPCNILNLTISRNKKLDVVANNSKTWDYTNPLLPLVENPMGNGHHHPHHPMNQMQGGKGPQQQGGMMGDHPLLPMPMNIAAAAAVAAAVAGGQHPFNPASPFMQGGPQQPGSYGQGPMHHQGGHGQQNQPPVPYNQVAPQSVTGYPMQSMDTRPAVVQVANFPEQVSLSIKIIHQKMKYKSVSFRLQIRTPCLLYSAFMVIF